MDICPGGALVRWLCVQRVGFLLLAVALGLALAACDDDDDAVDTDDLSGQIIGDGSSTVYPITIEVAEAFDRIHPDVHLVIGLRGTGTVGGFEGFCAGQTDFNNASRRINEEEQKECAESGVDYTEFQVAYDGLAILVHPSSDFVECLTVEELKRIWEPGSTIDNWSQVRGGFPDKELSLYGAGISGSQEYFTRQIVGERGASRSDYSSSEIESRLVERVASDEGALGYFGYGYYERDQERLRLVAVDNGAGCVAPSAQTILDGTYSPLSRPLYVYVKDRSLERPEVAEFMRYYLTVAPHVVGDSGFVPAEPEVYERGLRQVP